MLGNGGCSQREKRSGPTYMIANIETMTDMTLQSLLVEVFRVPLLMEWSEVCNKRDGTRQVTLPLMKDVDCFLDFLEDVRTVNNFLTPSNLIQAQYEIHGGFGSKEGFARLLRFLRDKDNLRDWLTRMLANVDKTRRGAPGVDAFNICRGGLARLLSSSLGSWNDEKMAFLSQHVLMNVNELVDDWPFGVPKQAVLGFGGKFGAKRLVRGLEEGHSVPEVLELQLKAVRETYVPNDLTLMGLERLEHASVVVVSANKRPVCVIDTEHFGCLDMISSERETGGSRGCSDNYEVTSPHCHPVPHARYYEQSPEINKVARDAMREHKARVDACLLSETVYHEEC
jgi:hypothetical protein